MDLKNTTPITLIRKSLVVFLLCGCAAAQATSMYKWVDDEGNVHYDQFPPTDHEAQKLGTLPNAAPPPEPDGDTAAPEQPKADEPPQDEAPPESTEDKVSKVLKQNCEAAKRNLDIYIRHNRIKQPDGSELVLSEEMREERIKQAEEDIEKFCQ